MLPNAPTDGRRRAIVEGVVPQVDGGRFPIKRIVGDRVQVEADAFADGHDVVTVVLRYRGPDGARQFWLNYRSTFGDVESSFRTVVSSKDAAALEWTTEGTVSGTPVRYDGVTVLELAGGKITRSCAYFDTTRLGRETLRARLPGPGGVDARLVDERDGWRSDPEEIG